MNINNVSKNKYDLNNYNYLKSFNIMWQYMNYEKQLLILDAYKKIKNKRK